MRRRYVRTVPGIKCTKCEQYSFSLRRCKLGKINPTTIKGGVEAAQIMGISYICDLSDKKYKIMYKLDEEWKQERAQEAGMLHGIDAYNDIMGE